MNFELGPGSVPDLAPGEPKTKVPKKQKAGPRDAGSALGLQMVGPTGFEPVTSPLSGVRSNQLSYEPV